MVLMSCSHSRNCFICRGSHKYTHSACHCWPSIGSYTQASSVKAKLQGTGVHLCLMLCLMLIVAHLLIFICWRCCVKQQSNHHHKLQGGCIDSNRIGRHCVSTANVGNNTHSNSNSCCTSFPLNISQLPQQHTVADNDNDHMLCMPAGDVHGP